MIMRPAVLRREKPGLTALRTAGDGPLDGREVTKRLGRALIVPGCTTRPTREPEPAGATLREREPAGPMLVLRAMPLLAELARPLTPLG